jgi:hypothetical protein
MLAQLELIRRAEHLDVPIFTDGEDIETWLRRYNLITDQIGLTDELKAEFVRRYIDRPIASQIILTGHGHDWTKTQKFLIDNYQLDADNLQKSRIAFLQSLKQGRLPVRSFRNQFRSQIDLLPNKDSERTLIRIFHNGLNPKLQVVSSAIGHTMDNWKSLAEETTCSFGFKPL